jgi:Protein of unknwon function (DUF3310).
MKDKNKKRKNNEWSVDYDHEKQPYLYPQGANSAALDTVDRKWSHYYTTEPEVLLPPKIIEVDYKFAEDIYLDEIKKYIDNTYSAHYAKTKLQAFEEIVDNGYGLGFAMGNVTKYNKRFGKKNGKNRDDLLKQIHYAILALYAHDYESEEE